MPVPVALLAALPAIAQAGVGAAQYVGGRNAARNNRRPEYQIPDSYLEALEIVRQQSRQRTLPGQDLMEDKLGNVTDRAVGNIARTSATTGESLAGLVQMYSNEMDARTNLDIEATRRYDANKARLVNAQNFMGRLEDFAFDTNEMQPYQDEAARASALMGAGLQNIMRGGTNAASAAVSQSLLGTEQVDPNGVNPRADEGGTSQIDAFLAKLGRFGDDPGATPMPTTQPIPIEELFPIIDTAVNPNPFSVGI